MIVTIQQFAIYKGLCRQTASKHYKIYLTILNTKRRRLTIADISKLDDVTESYILEALGFIKKNVKTS